MRACALRHACAALCARVLNSVRCAYVCACVCVVFFCGRGVWRVLDSRLLSLLRLLRELLCSRCWQSRAAKTKRKTKTNKRRNETETRSVSRNCFRRKTGSFDHDAFQNQTEMARDTLREWRSARFQEGAQKRVHSCPQ